MKPSVTLAFMVVVNSLYGIVLFSAAAATTGLLAGACLFFGILSTISTVALLFGFAFRPKKRK